ncbi:MAG TPA: hypothetical protein VME18_08055 [Acidobacteriaceae bacterium]|nr:hypothetical protein [Acidobacteriaceae bacterium]
MPSCGDAVKEWSANCRDRPGESKSTTVMVWVAAWLGEYGNVQPNFKYAEPYCLAMPASANLSGASGRRPASYVMDANGAAPLEPEYADLMPSPSAIGPRSSARASQSGAAGKGSRGGSLALWPLLICLSLDPFLVRAASIVALEGPKPFMLLYPWVEFLHLSIFHLTAERLSTLSQAVLYLQFPVYGLLMTLTFRINRKLRTLIYGLIAHFGGVALVVLFSYF